MSCLHQILTLFQYFLLYYMNKKYFKESKMHKVLVIGDCVEIRDKDQNISPPTAQIAEKSAEYVAKTIRKDINGFETKAFNASVEGVFVALGGNYAVGEMFKYIKVKAYWAYLLKKAITYSYYLGLKLRINTGFKNRIKEGPT